MEGYGTPVATGVPRGGAPVRALVIGASTGGPTAIEQVLRALPADIGIPVAVCQHISEGVTAQWARHLDAMCAVEVVEARDNQRFAPGRVHIAPSGRHMRITGDAVAPKVRLLPDFADCLFVPSIDQLMSSASVVYGSRLAAVLLTGLLSDGAAGMLAVRTAGGHTIAQCPDSAVAPSMPAAAIDLGAVAEVLPLESIGAEIVRLASPRAV